MQIQINVSVGLAMLPNSAYTAGPWWLHYEQAHRLLTSNFYRELFKVVYVWKIISPQAPTFHRPGMRLQLTDHIPHT